MIAESELRLIAEQRGLTRALALEPAVLNPIAERGIKPLPPVPSGPTTEPAGGYDPARHAEDA
jgi:hypothetical protein